MHPVRVHCHVRVVPVFSCLVFALASFGQVTSDPPLPPDERIDLTHDGIADVVITSETEHASDPELGPFMWQRRWVEFLPGTDVLYRTARGHGRLYELREGETLSVPELTEGFRFKQLAWSSPTDSVRFKVLVREVQQGVSIGWHTQDAFRKRTLVLRSTVGGRTVIADFTITFNIGTEGHIGVTSQQVFPVVDRFGDEPPAPPKPPVEDPYSFGHEEEEPPVIIPAGIPPDEEIDIVGDEAPDIIITAQEEYWHGIGRMGYYVRGVSPAPGVALLMKRPATNHPWEFFRLPSGAQFTPGELAAGLADGTLQWATPERGKVFCRVLQHPFGMDDKPQEWSSVDEEYQGDLIYRASYSEIQMVIGVIEVYGVVPGGELIVRGQNWVEEGKVLQVR